jgi:hypothetical protein
MQKSRFWLQMDPFLGIKFPCCDLSIMDGFIFTHLLNEIPFWGFMGKMAKNDKNQ